MALVFLPLQANAEILGGYGITGLGYSRMKLIGSTPSSAGPSEGSMGLRFGFGYRFSLDYAVELTLGQAGKVGGQAEEGSAAWSYSYMNYSVMGFLPSENKSAYFAKAGFQKTNLGVTDKPSLASVAPKSGLDRSTALVFSLGWQKESSKFSGWRFELERLFKVGNPASTGQLSVNTFHTSLYYGY